MAKRSAEADLVFGSDPELKRSKPRKDAGVYPAQPLPVQLDVEELVAARKSEILALHRAMAQARNSARTRAWQLLPRHLRRRAASHNLLRLPRRLRGKARAELRASNTTAKTRSQMRRRAPERTLLGYVRRRADLQSRAGRPQKRWLETHLWHAKRFRMTGDKQCSDCGPSRWGFTLAETPHHKSYRATWRKTKYATLHDKSYLAVFQLQASARQVLDAQQRLQLMLFLAGLAQGWETEWTSGARMCSTTLLARPHGRHREKAHAPYLPALAPVQVLWCPRALGETNRTCLLMAHPAAKHEIQNALTQALDTISAERRRPRHSWSEDIRWNKHVDLQALELDMAPPAAVAAGVFHGTTAVRTPRLHHAPPAPYATTAGFNVFEMFGDNAALVLGGILQPSASAKNAQASMLCRVLGQQEKKVIPPSQLPSGTVISCDVVDPRLLFPPHNQSQGGHEILDGQKWVNDAQQPLFADSKFYRFKKPPSSTQAEIDRRRARGMAAPTADDSVPIVLIQRVLPATPTTRSLYGYMLLVPRGWGAAFWKSLVHTGAQVLGQSQYRELHLNVGHPHFPFDWISHAAFVDMSEDAARRRKAQWLAKPPAKRPPLNEEVCAHPFGGRALWDEFVLQNGKHSKPVLLPYLGEAAARRLDSCMLCSNGNTISSEASSQLTKPSKLWTRRQYVDGVMRTVSQPLLRSLAYAPFVVVMLTACRKGAWEENATIHIPGPDTVPSWRLALDPPASQREAAKASLLQLEAQPVSAASAVGAVTSGDYALSTGHGRAIASITYSAWLELERREREAMAAETSERTWGRSKRNRVPLARLVLVRNPLGGPTRAASVVRLPTM